MKILSRPRDVLAALFTRPAMTARRPATDGPDKLFSLFVSLFWFPSQGTTKAAGDDKANQKTA
jgi:hypothetical protein